MRDRHIMWEVKHQHERVKMARWIVSYISPLGDATPWIKEKDVIKKVQLRLEAKFWWLLIKYRLILTALNNTLMWEGEELVAYLMVGYDVNFFSILCHELHDRAFGELTNMPFPCIVQRLCDEAGVPEIPGVDERVPAKTNAMMRNMKGLTYPGTSRRLRQKAAVPQDQSEGPTVSTEPTEVYRDDAGASFDMDIRGQREV